MFISNASSSAYLKVLMSLLAATLDFFMTTYCRGEMLDLNF